MRVGIVDVGSNTARLLVADVVSGRDVRTVEARKAYLGLGAEIADTGTLSPETVAAAATACRRYAKRARALGATRAEVIVTAPGRQGAASEALVDALRDRTGLPVRILSADDEGRLAFEGAIARAPEELPEVVGVVDVGGGSTEVVVGTPRVGPVWVRSIDLGSLRLTRLSLPGDPPGKRAARRARAEVREALSDVNPIRPDVAFAVGGSARALAKLVGSTFDPDRVDETIAALARRRSAKVARTHGVDLKPRPHAPRRRDPPRRSRPDASTARSPSRAAVSAKAQRWRWPPKAPQRPRDLSRGLRDDADCLLRSCHHPAHDLAGRKDLGDQARRLAGHRHELVCASLLSGPHELGGEALSLAFDVVVASQPLLDERRAEDAWRHVESSGSRARHELAHEPRPRRVLGPRLETIALLPRVRYLTLG